MPKLIKFSLRRTLSTLFSWQHIKQQQQQQHCKGTPGRVAAEMKSESVAKEVHSVDTELPVIERDNRNHHHLSYTSLRDLMPTSRPISPIKQKGGESLTGDREQEEDDPHWPGGTRLPIKNRLVEQAARAYLLPAAAQSTPSNQFFAHYWAKFTTSSRLHGHPSNEDLYASSVHGSGHLDGCSDCSSFSCLPSFLWLDLTCIFRCLFSSVRPQSVGFLQA